ncbi:OLC1v1022318C1 [Oldenlandia corymbosa var. corymbosa]|uniref:OLC1v1022318C1 n=1 Tax=Oldenlandia corymbosa var. corymbosa TaxID=529605 RepID=A0AAV1C1B4_OLDCO|nr:OLC1v1022318C1 [Oldenlandia corymbosa var. corymbosa]
MMSIKAIKVAVIGCGISGAVCASTLAKNGISVTVFDSGRGPGGRMSQRREIAEDGRELLFDHGAPYFTVSNHEVLGLVQEWESSGIVAPWNEKFGSFDFSSKKFLNLEEEEAPTQKYVGVPGMNSICHALSAEPGVTSRFAQSVARVEWLASEDSWSLTGINGEDLGQFEGVVACDRNCFFSRFANAAGSPTPFDLSMEPELASQLKDITDISCYTVMLAFEQPLTSIPIKGISFKNSEILSSAYCDSSKPWRSDSSEMWVLHSTVKYAEDIIVQCGLRRPSIAMLSKVAEELLQELQRTGLHIPRPFFLKAHGWGSAFPSKTTAAQEKCLWNGNKRQAICGDFCVSLNVEGAILSGLAAASKFTELISSNNS